MNFARPFALVVMILASVGLKAQRIVYSEADREDTRRMNFEVIGKVGGNFLVYKDMRSRSYISVYDNEMVQVSRKEQDYIPDDRLINTDFVAYNDFAYMIYQYQRKNVVYCEAVKLDANGQKVGDIYTLDTTHINFSTNNKVYSTLFSEDKNQIMVYKINSRNRNNFVITTVLFDNLLNQKHRSRFEMPMDDNHEDLVQFNLDNEGDLVFARITRNNNETIHTSKLFFKSVEEDTLRNVEISHEDIFLDELNIKVDNANKRYFMTSFYYTEKRGNIEGLYFYVWDKYSRSMAMENTVKLGDELRKEARGDANMKMAFNDYFIRNIIIKKDGGFIINAESYYTTSRYNSWNRWNYLYGSPFSPFDYYSSYSPVYNSWYWRNRMWNNGNSGTRYHADNVTILSFDNQGKILWNNVLHKEQFDDDADDRISFAVANTGNQLHYIFNMDEKRTLLLNDFTLDPKGAMSHNPTLKNLDRGYEFMPRYAKQVSARQVIIPCFHNNYICFAKIDFN